ncbi:hypothetical protein ACIQU1_23210 [Streptomyces angustmyceticus]
MSFALFDNGRHPKVISFNANAANTADLAAMEALSEIPAPHRWLLAG